MARIVEICIALLCFVTNASAKSAAIQPFDTAAFDALAKGTCPDGAMAKHDEKGDEKRVWCGFGFRSRWDDEENRHGPFEVWRKGVREQQGYYYAGLRHGEWREWHDNGHLAELEIYDKNLLVSEDHWYADGQRKSSWKADIATGDNIEYKWDNQGHLVEEIHGRFGVQHGPWIKYYVDGKKMDEMVYIHDDLVEARQWNQKGILIDERLRKPDGTCISEATWDDQGKQLKRGCVPQNGDSASKTQPKKS